MRTILLTGLAICASLVPAMAADVAPAYVPPPLAWSWTGFYVGANAGWAGSTDAVTNHGTDSGAGGLGTSLLLGGIPGAINLNQTGFIGGGQVGYNWQVAPTWVVGIEADFQGADAKGSNAFTFLGGPGILPITTTFTRELDWLGTLRGRFGYLWFPSLLFYGTGGLAYGQNKIGTTAVCSVDSAVSSGQHQPDVQYVRRVYPRGRRRVEICSRLERESRVPLRRIWPLQQHDLLCLRR
jgi:outer membrane immunogenic protein